MDITDLNRPNRRLNPGIKFLAMSGLFSGGLNKEMRQFADAFLAKPFKAEVLMHTVDNLLHPVPPSAAVSA